MRDHRARRDALDTTSPGEGAASSSSSRASTHASSSSSHASTTTTHASVGAGGGGGGTLGSGGSGGAGGQGGQPGVGGQGGSGGACCDCDGDGHDSIACGGDDCADHDASAFPGQTMFSSTPIVGTRSPGTDPYDFNCDGSETFQNTEVVDCSGSTPSCDAADKWVGSVPACGDSGMVAHCAQNGLMCKVVMNGSRTQSCL